MPAPSGLTNTRSGPVFGQVERLPGLNWRREQGLLQCWAPGVTVPLPTVGS